MNIIKMAVGNADEAYIEDSFSDGVNIIYSDDNNKGKTIVIQSMLFALGNKPIFPDSFDYKKYFHYIEIEHEGSIFTIVRLGDSFVVRSADGIRMYDGLSEFKRFWNANVFQLPQIMFNGGKKIVDMELFIQLFFVGQDGKDTSDIFNAGYYHKDDYRNMVVSFAGDYDSEISEDEVRKIRDQIKKLTVQRQEQLSLSEFYKSSAVATEYLSRIKDQDAFQARVAEMDAVNEHISEVRKLRSRTASQKSQWNATLKELRSLNRNIEVGELRCMDCNSNRIAYKGTGKITYSFDVSTQKMRDQIIASIIERMATYDEEIAKYDYEIASLQKDLQELMQDEDVTIENIVAYKKGYHSTEEIEATVQELDIEISGLKATLEQGIQVAAEAKEQRIAYYKTVVDCMNQVRETIDPEGTTQYTDLFTKRGTVASGSEETVFYASKLIAIALKTKHKCPIIIDSFRAEDLSSEKEKRVLELLKSSLKQCILTTTLKTEEKGKYAAEVGITGIDYTEHQSNKLLLPDYVPDLELLLSGLHMMINI